MRLLRKFHISKEWGKEPEELNQQLMINDPALTNKM